MPSCAFTNGKVTGLISKPWWKCCLVIQILLVSSYSYANHPASPGKTNRGKEQDTIFVRKGTHFYLFGRVAVIRKDTFFILSDTSLHLKNISHKEQTAILYDSIYSKFSRNKISRLLYPLAFKPPQPRPLSLEKMQAITDESPFLQYKGKVIRKIRIKCLAPFGTNVGDTTSGAITGIGRALNSVHMNTHTDVIRKNLLFKRGQRVDPDILADNERILRDLPFIDRVHTYITEAGPGSDTVDLIIATEDVWSIGFDINTITPNKILFHLNDGNFLGRGDRLGTSMSFEIDRAPFFRFDQGSYELDNIAGTFFTGVIDYQRTDEENENIRVGVQRPFFSYKTRWAGGGYFQYAENTNESLPEEKEITAYSDDIYLWAGRSFLFRKNPANPRFVILESYYRRFFSSRPPVTIDSNFTYYNVTRLFTGIAFSKNNYYLSDYIFQFGKTENLPYGSLFQLTLGPEFSEFYTRFYGGGEISMGNFFNSFGYLSGELRFGGFFDKGSLQDAVVKVGFRYMTPLIKSLIRNYRFRFFFNTDYRHGFNLRPNNIIYGNISNIVRISNSQADSVFMGVQSCAVSLENVLYTPWYFYGFKFGIMTYFQGGIVAKSNESLARNRFFAGAGLGLLIKNDNLIFPTLMLTVFIYPSVNHLVPYFESGFVNSSRFSIPDFNVTGPRVETLLN
jgi:hypothetical protein